MYYQILTLYNYRDNEYFIFYYCIVIKNNKKYTPNYVLTNKQFLT